MTQSPRSRFSTVEAIVINSVITLMLAAALLAVALLWRHWPRGANSPLPVLSTIAAYLLGVIAWARFAGAPWIKGPPTCPPIPVSLVVLLAGLSGVLTTYMFQGRVNLAWVAATIVIAVLHWRFSVLRTGQKWPPQAV